MSLRAWVSRVLAPGLSYCARCRTSFWGPIRNEHHTTTYENGAGCFPLCESCWHELTPTQRMPYYDALVDRWIAGFPENREKYERDRRRIYLAVMNGG